MRYRRDNRATVILKAGATFAKVMTSGLRTQGVGRTPSSQSIWRADWNGSKLTWRQVALVATGTIVSLHWQSRPHGNDITLEHFASSASTRPSLLARGNTKGSSHALA